MKTSFLSVDWSKSGENVTVGVLSQKLIHFDDESLKRATKPLESCSADWKTSSGYKIIPLWIPVYSDIKKPLKLFVLFFFLKSNIQKSIALKWLCVWNNNLAFSSSKFLPKRFSWIICFTFPAPSPLTWEIENGWTEQERRPEKLNKSDTSVSKASWNSSSAF